MSDDTNPRVPIPSARTLWLTEAQTAERLGLSVKWLQKERGRGSCLRYAKFGRAVRYSIADIECFEQNCLRTNSSEDAPVLRSE